MNKINLNPSWYMGAIFLLTIASCKQKGGQYHSITDKINAESENYLGATITSDRYINDLKTVEVTEKGITFLIPERKGEMESYTCTECHSKPLKQMKSEDLKKAHWNITVNHADDATMNCATCHDSEDMDHLKSLIGQPIDFNNSYQLCSQCHQKEYKDWTGGAHGKRLESWAPPRVSMTCVNCHNPHDPYFASKWPERYNTQIVEERK